MNIYLRFRVYVYVFARVLPRLFRCHSVGEQAKISTPSTNMYAAVHPGANSKLGLAMFTFIVQSAL